MFTLTISLDSLSIYIVAVDILVLLIYILYLFQKKRALDASIKSISSFITVYFMNTGAEVKVSCFKVEGDKHFVTLVESKPLKRFRYSNVLENNLISHIFKTTGNVVEKIYWRFPIQLSKADDDTADAGDQFNDDTYFTDVPALVTVKPDIDYSVSELSWDEFQGLNKKQE
jgi:hypothetical protein